MEIPTKQPKEGQFRKCLWFDHYVVPYFGYYDSDTYDLIEPDQMICHQDTNIISKYSPKMFGAFKKFIHKHPETDVEIGQIHYTISRLKTHEIKKRTNIVMHFLCMRDKDTANNESYYLNSSIYADNHLGGGITQTAPNSDTLVFNTDNLEDNSNEVNIIFHDEEYLSPDNCAIYINHAYQYLTFGLLAAYKIHPDDKNYKLFAAMFFVNNTPLLLKGLPEKLQEFSIDHFSTYHLSVSQELSNLIDLKIATKSTRDLIAENSFFQAIQSFEDHFYEFFWIIFDRPKILDFGKNLYLNLNLRSQILFLLIFAHHLLTISFQSLCSYFKASDYTPVNSTLEFGDFIRKQLDRVDQEEDDDISQQIDQIIECFNFGNSEEAKENFNNNLNSFFQSYLFERAWVFKGERLDVPLNFGQMILLNLEGVSEEEHLTFQEKIYILESLKSKFDLNSYQDKIMFL